MSSRANAIVFYGVCFTHDSEDGAKFQSRDDGETEGEGSLAWMAANLYREARDGAEVVHFGHHDYCHYAAAVEGTVQYGSEWSALALGERVNEDCTRPQEDAALRAFCEKHGLTWSDPKWYAVPHYG